MDEAVRDLASVWISLSRPAPEDQMLQGALGEEWENVGTSYRRCAFVGN